MMGNRALIAAVAALCANACTNEVGTDDPVVLDDGFDAAAREYGVPVDLLKAIAYVESGWQAASPEEGGDGDVDELGRPVAYGVFALRGDNLTRGALAAGVDIDQVRSSSSANIEAAAARLAELA